jgi:uncharacterized protein YmfQ (DUF2313 family)
MRSQLHVTPQVALSLDQEIERMTKMNWKASSVMEWAAPAQERQLRLERHPATCAKGETEGETMRERRHGTEEEKEAVTWLGIRCPR